MDQAIITPPATSSYVGQAPDYTPPPVPAPYPGDTAPASTGGDPPVNGFAPLTPPLSTLGPPNAPSGTPAPLVLGQTDSAPKLLPSTFRTGTFLQSSETSILPVSVSGSAKVTTAVD